MRITLSLTKREAGAVLRSQWFTNGTGVRKSVALEEAQMKIIGAISAASQPEADVMALVTEAEQAGGDPA